MLLSYQIRFGILFMLFIGCGNPLYGMKDVKKYMKKESQKYESTPHEQTRLIDEEAQKNIPENTVIMYPFTTKEKIICMGTLLCLGMVLIADALYLFFYSNAQNAS